MKTLLLSCLFILGTGLTFAQNQSEIGIVSPADLTLIKEKGILNIELPEDQTNEDVQAKAKFYTHYFTVNYDEIKHLATVTMVSNDEKSRAVIIRFLTAVGVNFVKIGADIISTEDFYSEHLK